MGERPRYAITRWRSLRDVRVARASEVYWPALVRWMMLARPAHQGDAQPGWSPATFQPPKRAAANARAVSLLGLDCDAGDPIEQAWRCWRDYLAALVTSRRHTPEHPRYRIVVALSRSVSPAEHAALWTWAAARCAEHGVRLDPAARDPSRFWFVPAGQPQVIECAGSPIDVDEILERQAIQSAEAEAEAEMAARRVREGGEGGQPSATRGNGGARGYGAAALAAECGEVAATPPGGRNQRLNTASFRIGQLIAGGEVSEGEALAALAAAAHRCGLPEREATKTIQSGMRAGAREPRHAPERPEQREAGRPAGAPRVAAEVIAPAAGGEGATVTNPITRAWNAWGELPDDWLLQRPAPRRWLLRHPAEGTEPGDGMLVRGKVGLLTAEGGASKTMLLVSLALAVATGRPWLGHFAVAAGARGGRVLLALGEEDTAELQRRLWLAARAMGLSEAELRAAMRRIVGLPLAGKPCELLTVVRDAVVTTPTYDVLRRRLRDAAGDGWALLAFDPLIRWGGGHVESDNLLATRGIQLFEALTETPGQPTVVVSQHSSKLARRLGQADSRGVTGLTDGARWVGTLTVEGEDVLLRQAKSNYSRPWREPVRLVRVDGGGGVLRAASPADLKDREQRRQAAAAEQAADQGEADLATLVDVLARQRNGEFQGSKDELARLAGLPCKRGRAAWALGVTNGSLAEVGSTRNRRLRLARGGA